MNLLIEIVPIVLSIVAVLFTVYIKHEANKEKQSWHDNVWKIMEDNEWQNYVWKMIKDNEKPWEEWAKDIENVISKKADKPDS